MNELWKKKLEDGGFKVIEEIDSSASDPDKTGQYKTLRECQKCGTMYANPNSGCPLCGCKN